MNATLTGPGDRPGPDAPARDAGADEERSDAARGADPADHPDRRAASRLRRAAPWALLVARLGLAGVWVVAGALKVADPAASVRAVRAYQLLPEALVPAVGYALPFVEIALGVLLLVGLGTRTAAAVSAVLLVVFVVGVSAAWARGLSIDCGCFGGGGEVEPGATRYVEELVRDTAFLAASLALLVRPRTRWAVDSFITPAAAAAPTTGETR
ncbi:MauE/DoxX family redox-associated membrane protein [Thalassiella azotivora]